MTENTWFDDGEEEEAYETEIDEYDVTASPNDFNISTIVNFIDAGAIQIPGFQRNYVWDLKRASKLIESLILGLPVPQVFLYEEARNKFIVIDGQQRLMSIYYFTKRRFPRMDRRGEIRSIWNEHGSIPEFVLEDDNFYQPFRLSLPERAPDRPNRFKGLNYSTLGDHKFQFDLRPVRNIIVKQNTPADDDSSVYEIFNRLNTGGVNLKPQEIRASMYHSRFYDALLDVNRNMTWRRLLAMPVPDIHMKDIEILLRASAMLVNGNSYSPSMAKFLNRFSKQAKSLSSEKITELGSVFEKFFAYFSDMPEDVFQNATKTKFSIPLFEAVFRVVGETIVSEDELTFTYDEVRRVMTSPEFVAASSKSTSDTSNVRARYEIAKADLCR